MLVLFDPDARQEFLDAIDFYEEKKPGLGAGFGEQVELAVTKILDAPQRWPICEEYFRRCLTDVFPYAIIYMVDKERIFIVAVMHCSRQPGYWKNRLR